MTVQSHNLLQRVYYFNLFVEKSKNIHKHTDETPLYDYSKVKYVNSKEKVIMDNGYNLIVMWESKWKKINRYIKIIQKQYRRFKCSSV